MDAMPSLTIDLNLRLGYPSPEPVFPPRVPLWQVRDSAFIGPTTARPAIVTLLAQPVDVTQDWQYYLRALNPGMSVQHVAAIMGWFRAFCNGTGVGDASDPRRNYLTGEDMDANEDPQFDKVRSCIRSVVTGIETETEVILDMLDGSSSPPMKPGKQLPQTLAEIRLADYLYSPQSHPWYFFAAVNVEAGRVTPFPNGAVYSWTGDGKPYTFLPHVSRFAVRMPKTLLRRLGDDEPIPSPYV
jgi:hypothetical protein